MFVSDLYLKEGPSTGLPALQTLALTNRNGRLFLEQLPSTASTLLLVSNGTSGYIKVKSLRALLRDHDLHTLALESVRSDDGFDALASQTRLQRLLCSNIARIGALPTSLQTLLLTDTDSSAVDFARLTNLKLLRA